MFETSHEASRTRDKNKRRAHRIMRQVVPLFERL